MADDSRMRWLPPGRGPDPRQLVPGRRLRHPLRRQVAHQPRRPDRPGHRRGRWPPTTTTARSTRAAVQAYLDADPLDPYGFSGWVGPEPHGAAAGQQRPAPRPADRRPGGRLARGPLRPPPGRRRRRAAPVPAGRQLREPARHRAVPGVGAGSSPIEPSPLDPPPVPPAPTADEDLRDEAGGPDRLPGRLPVGLRAGAGRSPASTSDNEQALPRPLLPAPRRGRRPARPGAPGRHRGRLDRRRARPHRRPRRAARRPRRPAPEVVQPLRRGHPGAVHRRPRRRASRPPPRAVDDMPTSHVDLVPTLLAAAGIDQARRRRRAAPARSPRSTPLPGRDLHAGRRRRRRRSTATAPVYLHDPRQHARGRHRGVRPGPPARADRATRRCRCASRCRPTWARTSRASSSGSTRPTPPAAPATSGSWCAPSTIPPPGPSPASATWRRRPGRPVVPHRAARRPVGAVRPRRRPDRGRQPLVRRRAAPSVRRPAADAAEGRAAPTPCPSATTRGPTSTRRPTTPDCQARRRPRPGCSAGPSSSSACTPPTPAPIPASTSPAAGR